MSQDGPPANPPADIGQACLFLASPASSMISGQAIGIDGHTEAYHL